ncbi:MAG TPA: Vi polysaccharide biosynthesis UDP-N-acetylglucosamine C-6 dehydrogenase TviB, partial [Nautiliaceae bacterium]|nr:Vi polysaccharide biosynthesis UDP-N-acetylglucosamine C-6 dehydrogenase TviB [Nautiliaceae bacterium]
MKDKIISIVGLGYVGLPLAVAFARKYKVIGFDINENRIKELKKGYDRTLEVSEDELKNVDIKYTSNLNDLKEANIHIITVPTPIDKHKNPDLTPLIKA